MGSNESHFNVSLIVRDKVTRQCPQTTTFEVKGEPKRNRTEVLMLTSLTPYRWAKPAQNVSGSLFQALNRETTLTNDDSNLIILQFRGVF